MCFWSAITPPSPAPYSQGNIRVFARVRPSAAGEAAEAAPGRAVVALPGEGDLEGRGLELLQPGASGAKGGGEAQTHSFGFDRVFAPSASQVGRDSLALQHPGAAAWAASWLTGDCDSPAE